MLVEDPKTERFTYKGRPLPRLTDILQDLGIVDYDAIPQHVRDFAMDRGGKVHKTTELWDRGILRVETLDERLMPYLQGWRQAVLDLKLAFTHIETRLVNEVYWYTTKPDRVGTADGLPAVVEIKSGELEWWTGLQLAAQAACLPDGHLYKRIGIELPGNGTYRPHYFTDANDRALILSGISLYNKKKQHSRGK